MKAIKSLFIFLMIQFLGSAAIAQIIVTDPTFPTETSEVTITYDATEGNGQLAGFTGDVYLHTGVITSNSTSSSDWQYVPFEWTEHDASMKATPLGNDKWEFTYGPSVREFFGITDAGEEVQQIAIVFKGVENGNVTAEGKDTGNSDIFVELYEGETNAQFISPADDVVILDRSDTFEIEGAGSTTTGTISLSLHKNGNEVQTVSSESLTYSYTPEVSDTDVTFELIADDNQGTRDTASVFFTIKDNNGQMLDRPAGLQDGITRNPDGSVTLSLFAPSKEYVYVIGSFNDWTPSSDYLMNVEHQGTDSTWFWIELNEDLGSADHAFQYLVNGDNRISDPYSELVLDPYNDQYISNTTFPNLMPYPSEETQGWVTYLRLEQNFTWEATNYQRPDKEELVIYELLIRDFLEEGNYQTLTDTLDYLENLGVNAIELMPVNEFDGNLSWGYNPNHHLALDKAYGTPEAFKKFVDEAHKRNIAVILDVVMNHATDPNPFYQLYGNDDNYYFNSQARHAYNVFNDFDHSYSGTQYYNKRMIEHWIEEYNIDGFRWDLTKGFTQNCAGDESCTGSYQQDRVDVLKKYADYQWAADPEFIVIFEHLGGEQEEAEWANYRVDEGKGVMLWGNMNNAYSEATMGYNSNLYGVLSESRSSFENRHLVGYMESHDEQWMMFKNLEFGACENYPAGGNGCETNPGYYNIRDLNTALQRQKLAGAFFFTLPGPKMIWQFGELGYGGGPGECLKPGDGSNGDCLASDPSRVGEKPIRWDYYDDEDRMKLYKAWSALLTLRHSSSAFTDPATAEYGLSGSVKTITLQHSDSDVVIVGNFGVEKATPTVTFPSTGTWYNYFGGTSETISNTEQEVPLGPGVFEIFTTKEFSTPDNDLVTSKEEGREVPSSYKLGQNYPNPFNPTTTISYELAEAGMVELEVFDLLGRKVANVVNERKASGTYSVNFDASKLSSGIYIYRLQANGKVLTKKMTLIK